MTSAKYIKMNPNYIPLCLLCLSNKNTLEKGQLFLYQNKFQSSCYYGNKINEMVEFLKVHEVFHKQYEFIYIKYFIYTYYNLFFYVLLIYLVSAALEFHISP